MALSDERNWRIEKTMKTDTFTCPGGEQVQVTYASSECSVYDRTCPVCGQDWEARGIMGALLDSGFGGKCPECRENQATSDDHADPSL